MRTPPPSARCRKHGRRRRDGSTTCGPIRSAIDCNSVMIRRNRRLRRRCAITPKRGYRHTRHLRKTHQRPPQRDRMLRRSRKRPKQLEPEQTAALTPEDGWAVDPLTPEEITQHRRHPWRDPRRHQQTVRGYHLGAWRHVLAATAAGDQGSRRNVSNRPRVNSASRRPPRNAKPPRGKRLSSLARSDPGARGTPAAARRRRTGPGTPTAAGRGSRLEREMEDKHLRRQGHGRGQQAPDDIGHDQGTVPRSRQSPHAPRPGRAAAASTSPQRRDGRRLSQAGAADRARRFQSWCGGTRPLRRVARREAGAVATGGSEHDQHPGGISLCRSGLECVRHRQPAL